MSDRVFGEIKGYPEDTWFESRKALAESGVHRPNQAGISGSEKEGADSVVLSGGYDDQDDGDVIIYTGEGGRDPNTGKQVEHQTLTGRNLALARSRMLGLPVRVIRGAGQASIYSPKQGYRYAGLYMVDDYWHDIGPSGYTVWRFRLVKVTDAKLPVSQPAQMNQPLLLTSVDTVPASLPQRVATTTMRIVRDTSQARKVKVMYDFRCQVCDVRLEGSAGPYAESAHVKPLGAPHNGLDTVDNILCLCPNHHVLLDIGGFAIDDDLSLVGLGGSLHMAPGHLIKQEYLRYRREHYLGK